MTAALASLAIPSPRHAEASRLNVIVAAADGAVADATRTVARLGGVVGRPLSLIDGFGAQIPASALETLRRSASVRFVTADVPVRPLGLTDSTSAPASGPGKPGRYETVESGLLSTVTRIVGAQSLWEDGYTGRGVDVALIDTGVAPVQGLQPYRIVNGPDLSFDYQAGLPASIDAYGHGTHMAGIIAGRDDGVSTSAAGCGACLGSSGYSDATKFVGVAPEARIVNVKVGAFDGTTDVSQVIAAIDWVVQHRNDNGLNIRVLNLSFGTDATQGYEVDPLAYAVEVAWRKGIFVVAAAGNDGTQMRSLANPATNPTILAVGAEDPRRTLDRLDDVVPEWASRGTVTRHVDVVAPGVSIQSLAVPGSYVATNHPEGLVGERFMRGTGTSQAAAVTSGVAALLIQKHPEATPDALKRLLMATAYPMPGDSALTRGAGLVDAEKAAKGHPTPAANQPWSEARGTGSLELARGSVHVAIGDDVLAGEQDIFGSPWDGQRWSARAWAGTTWSGGTWNGQRWSGATWSGGAWENATWTGATWSGQSWSGQRWSGMAWDGQSWSGQSWSGQSWSGQSWSGQSWSGQSWSGQSWSGQSWSGQSWSGQSWS